MLTPWAGVAESDLCGPEIQASALGVDVPGRRIECVCAATVEPYHVSLGVT